MTDSSEVRKNNFNLLRLVLALLVLLSHAPELVDGNRHRELLSQLFHTISFGEFAVDGFFLLSGFLILQSWNNKPRLVDFMRNRILRIFPGFIAATLVCVLVVGKLASLSPAYFATLPLTELIQTTLLLKSPAIPKIFEGSHYPVVNGAMWTISYEFVCYLCILSAGLLGLTKKRFLCIFFALGLLTIFALQRFGFLESVPGHYLWEDPFVRLGSFFLAGSSFYLYRELIEFNLKYVTFAATALVIGMFSWRLSELALVTAGGYLLFYLAFKQTGSLAKFNKFPDVSYGVYLYGWPAQKLLLLYFPSMSPWLLFISSSVAAIFCGVISWYAVEKPFLKMKSDGNSFARYRPPKFAPTQNKV